MDYSGFTPNNSTTTYGNFSDNNTVASDFMGEFLSEGCWLETSTGGFNFLPPAPLPSTTLALNDPSSHYYLPSLDSNPHQQMDQEDQTEGAFPESESILVEGTELGRRRWIGPRANPGPCSSVKERLVLAIEYLKECTKNMNVLIQLWVPIRKGGRYFLSTYDQPYSFDPNSKSLADYRNVSRAYQFAVEEDREESVGIPGRVFLGRLPEWTPDVRFFKRDEYPRISYAQQYDIRGSLALPVFERGSGTCLGVVEIVTTTQKINYRPELQHVCQALEAVDLRSSQYFSPPSVKACDELYQAALNEIVEVITSVCKTHRLPLALTWAPCVQQGKGGCRHSDENFTHCVSTVDTACYVADLEFLGFLEACSEYHLFRGQGTVGTAFTTTKPCFATDITAFSKTEYPLSHHARMFGLRAAVAIPLRSFYSGSADFVLEFFLPKDCQDPEEQKQMLNSLSIVLQQACQNLHAVVDKELEEEAVLYPVKEVVVASDGKPAISSTTNALKEACSKESSWLAHMMEAQQKGKGVSISLEYQEEEPNEEFKVTTHWDNSSTQVGLRSGQAFSEFGAQLQRSSESKGSVEGGGDSYSYGGRHSSGGRKAGEKRKTKTEKTISLPFLRQYFAGSLKDAAKSIGVCPTTLKRICRQHGITRWPSRKIKKVGHSLRKLQLVIDSVQGAEGSIKIDSFYNSFPEFSSQQAHSTFSSLKISDNSNSKQESGLFSFGSSAPLKSPASSCSQTSSSSIYCATGVKQHSTTINALSSADTLMTENLCGILHGASCSDAELHALNQHEPNLIIHRAESLNKSIGEHPGPETLPPSLLPESSSQNSRDGCGGGAFRVKATFGDVKIRFSLHPNWSFGALQLEIARRFNLDDVSRVDIKYLDDDCEWILLTCDADLQECMEIFRASQGHTIRLSLHHASNQSLGSPFGRMACLKS